MTFYSYFFTNNKMVQKSIEKSVRYMLIPILLLKSQHTLHTYFGEQNEKLNSYNIFRYNLSGLTFQISSSYVTTKLCMDLLCTFFAKLWNRFDIIFNSNFIDLHEELFKLTEPFTGVSMRTHSAIHRKSSDYPKNNFLSLEFAMGSDMKTQKM